VTASRAGRIVYQEQHDDTRAALGWLTQQSGVDAERIGLWGSSYSGAHAVFLGAFDPRVKVVVAQVPGLDVRRDG
jgi:cephalosporin-C deacetylase-like acetyl esterase